jgi:hypothetical protein
VKGVLDRFGQIEPRVLFTADGYWYAGKEIDSLGRIRDIVSQIASIEHVVVVPYLKSDANVTPIPRATTWSEFLGGSRPEARGQKCRVTRILPRAMADLTAVPGTRFPSPDSRDFRSTTRFTSCTRQARRVCPSAWSMAPAGRCCSISRNSSSTPT